MSRVYVGMDMGSKVTAVAARDESGELLERLTFKTSRDGIIAGVTRYGFETVVMMEEGEMAGWAYRTLLPYVEQVIVCDPKRNAWISKGSKSDEIDAEKLSELLRIKSFSPVYHTPNEDIAAFKVLVQHYEETTKRSSRQMVQIKAMFRSQGVFPEGQAVYGPEGRNDYLSRVDNTSTRIMLTREYELLDYLIKKKAEAMSQVTAMSRQFPVIERFKRIPGIGPVLSARFVAYVQDPGRFNKRGLWKFSCLGVVSRSSDGVPLGREHLDRSGNGVMKDLSKKAFDGAMRTKEMNPIKAFYRRSSRRCKDPVHARLNTQRKILAMMRAMWRDCTEYSDDVFLGLRA